MRSSATPWSNWTVDLGESPAVTLTTEVRNEQTTQCPSAPDLLTQYGPAVVFAWGAATWSATSSVCTFDVADHVMGIRALTSMRRLAAGRTRRLRPGRHRARLRSGRRELRQSNSRSKVAYPSRRAWWCRTRRTRAQTSRRTRPAKHGQPGRLGEDRRQEGRAHRHRQVAGRPHPSTAAEHGEGNHHWPVTVTAAPQGLR